MHFDKIRTALVNAYIDVIVCARTSACAMRVYLRMNACAKNESDLYESQSRSQFNHIYIYSKRT